MSRFIDVSITDETTPVSRAGFGLALILDPSNAFGYTEVRELSDIPAEASELAEDMANQYLSQQPNPGVVAMVGKDVGGTEEDDPATVTDALNLLVEEHNDWYGLLLASREQSEIEEADAWIPANKLLITQPVEDGWAGELDGYDLTSIKTGAFPSVAEQEIDAAIMSRMFATDPGTATWKWKTLSGVGPSGYTNAEVSDMLSPGEGEPNMNPVIHEMGVNYTAEGKTVTGGYLDVQRAIDWLEARITENVFQLLVTQGKVSYTNVGIGQVVSRITEILRVAKNRDVLLEFTVTAPDRDEIPTATRANRILPDINFTGIVAGAVHEVSISGVVRV